MGWRGVPIEGLVWLAGKVSKTRRTGQHESPASILVLRPNDLGDLLTATPIFEALRTRFPSAHIIAGVGSWGRQIVENNPYIDEIVEFDAPWNNKAIKDQSWRAMLTYIFSSPQVTSFRQRGGVDVVIDVLGSHVGSILMMRLGARYLIGVRGYRGGWSACDRYIHFSFFVHVARAALAQAELLGATVLPDARPQLYVTDLERAEATRIWADGDNCGRPRLLVACGGGHELKCWPAEQLGAALKSLSLPHNSPGGPPNILLIGGPADRERAARVLSVGVPGARSICGNTSLRTTSALTQQADVVLSNASMMLHVAAAFTRPTIAVLGGIHPDTVEHDTLWGYLPPYLSIGPRKGELWPSSERVVEALKSALTPAAQQTPGSFAASSSPAD